MVSDALRGTKRNRKATSRVGRAAVDCTAFLNGGSSPTRAPTPFSSCKAGEAKSPGSPGGANRRSGLYTTTVVGYTERRILIPRITWFQYPKTVRNLCSAQTTGHEGFVYDLYHNP